MEIDIKRDIEIDQTQVCKTDRKFNGGMFVLEIY